MATATLSPGVPPEDPPPSAASAPDATADGAVSATSTPSHSLATPTEFLEHLHPELTDDEEAAAAAFLDVVNPWRYSRGYEPLSYPSAVKFLMARKFHVDRTLYLYQQHEVMRIREGLTVFDPTQSPLKEELATEKFTILPARDSNGATLALFNAHKHDPSQASHRTTLQCVVYQLDVALEELATQRGGLVFIYNMSGSKYSNFDYDLSQKMLTLLKGAYPARLKKVLIVTAPLWFKAPFKVLRLFVREKLRDRVFTVSIPQLQVHIPAESIPKDLGGKLIMDHMAWLTKCAEVTENKDGELVTMSSSQPTTPAEHKKKKHPTLEQLETLPISLTPPTTAAASHENGSSAATSAAGSSTAAAATAAASGSSSVQAATANNSLSVSPRPLSSSSGGHNNQDVMGSSDLLAVNGGEGGGGGAGELGTSPNPDDILLENGHHDNPHSNSSGGLSDDEAEKQQPADDSGMSLPEFIQHVRAKGRRGLYDEYSEIKNRPPIGTFNYSRMLENQNKNRYTDVLCYDHSRVILEDNGHEGDYINANYVDGYHQPRAFISSQGPLPKTFPDFWQMIWEQRVQVIVMTTKTIERHRPKCGQYWPEDCGTSIQTGLYVIHSEDIENSEDFVVTHLSIKNLMTDEQRAVCHFQFVSWPDYGVPESAVSMLHFLQRVREKQAEMVDNLGSSWTGHVLGPPIVVHCSAGIGRTGTFATLDSAIRKFKDIGKVDIRSTVERIRSQRAFSIQMPDQYVFCHLAFLEYVLNMEYVEEIDLTGFDDDCDSE